MPNPSADGVGKRLALLSCAIVAWYALVAPNKKLAMIHYGYRTHRAIRTNDVSLCSTFYNPDFDPYENDLRKVKTDANRCCYVHFPPLLSCLVRTIVDTC